MAGCEEDFIDIESDEDHDARNELIGLVQQYNNLVSAIILLLDYYTLYLCKSPCMTSSQNGHKWVWELLHGHPIRFHNMFRMSQQIFNDLLITLETSYDFHGSKRTSSIEILAMVVYVLAHNESIRATSERFQHSTETVSRYFNKGLIALVKLSMQMISPIDKKFLEIPTHILNDMRYMPYFKDCIGAIDGTHIDARISVEDQIPYIGRHHRPTQNVMAVCDFNMCFTFVAPGWEGSAHDARIFQHSVMNPKNNFPAPPSGKFYLVDAGYPLQKGYLKPYSDTRYHIQDFNRSNRPIASHKEIFNKAHSSLRSVIERTFGIWKKKWRILKDMPSYSFRKQSFIVVATMTLHNFIKRHRSCMDPDFLVCDNDENFIHPEANQFSTDDYINIMDSGTHLQDGFGAEEMEEIRDAIAMQLYDFHRLNNGN